MHLKKDAEPRNVTEIRANDFVKLEDGWHKVTYNSAYLANGLPRRWEVKIEDGKTLNMLDILRYAKAEDFEDGST